MPTVEGARVAYLAECVLSQVRAIEATFRRDSGSEVAGRLSLGATQSLAIDLITSFLPAFRARQPGISVDVRPFESPDEAVDALRRAELDLVLLDLPMPSDLRVQPFHHHEIVLVSPLELKLPDPVPWPALNDMPMIMPTAGSVRHNQFDRLFTRHGIFPRVVMETDERGAWVSCVAEGHGSLLRYREIAQRFASTVAIRRCRRRCKGPWRSAGRGARSARRHTRCVHTRTPAACAVRGAAAATVETTAGDPPRGNPVGIHMPR